MKKAFKEWGAFVLVLIFLYTTGLYTHVAAFAQTMVLKTGLFDSTAQLDEGPRKKADYSLSMLQLDGTPVKLEAFKGKVIFLNIWATWCPPCRAEMPDIQALYEQLGSENVAFVMLSVDKDRKKVSPFIQKKEFTFPVYHADGPLPQVFYSPSIPTTYIIGKDGTILTKKVGMASYNTKGFRAFLRKHAGQ